MHRAARVWTHRDAKEAGMLPQYESLAYALDAGAHTRGDWKPRGIDAHYEEVANKIEAQQPPNALKAWRRRREQNCLRAGMWAFNAVPWIPELTLTHAEWDIAWRLTLGGMTAEMRARIDAPIGGFANRGRKMELAFMRAISECDGRGPLDSADGDLRTEDGGPLAPRSSRARGPEVEPAAVPDARGRTRHAATDDACRVRDVGRFTAARRAQVDHLEGRPSAAPAGRRTRRVRAGRVWPRTQCTSTTKRCCSEHCRAQIG